MIRPRMGVVLGSLVAAKAHHAMNPMSHDVPNLTGVSQRGIDQKIEHLLPGYVPMGQSGMARWPR